ncbi:MAG: helix-turn-helix transcriptional regulator [Acidobacteria bacterium]|nr:helix-turn-helix transcriptional regulator [Acidobacteriota bacterium]
MEPTKIEVLARARGLTQEDIARQAPLTLSTVRRLWQDRDYSEDPKISTLRLIARVLAVRVAELGYSEDWVQTPDKQMSLAAA